MKALGFFLKDSNVEEQSRRYNFLYYQYTLIFARNFPVLTVLLNVYSY
jgi:hypothetical protein